MYEEQKISSPTRDDYEKDKENIEEDALVFLEDEDKLITPYKEYQFVPEGVNPNNLKNIKGLYVSDISNKGGSITITLKSYYDGAETIKDIDLKTLGGKSLFGQGDIRLSDLNEFDVLSATVDALDRRIGEINQILEQLQAK